MKASVSRGHEIDIEILNFEHSVSMVKKKCQVKIFAGLRILKQHRNFKFIFAPQL